MFLFQAILFASVAQLDRALDSDSKGRRFDSYRAHQINRIRIFLQQEKDSDLLFVLVVITLCSLNR